jgi:hypothetical protein
VRFCYKTSNLHSSSACQFTCRKRVAVGSGVSIKHMWNSLASLYHLGNLETFCILGQKRNKRTATNLYFEVKLLFGLEP